MSIYVRASTGARFIIWFRSSYMPPKHTPLYLLAVHSNLHTTADPKRLYVCIHILYVANNARMGY